MAKVPTAKDLELKARIDKLDAERNIIKSQLDRARLTDITSSLIETITSPEMVTNMKKLRIQAKEGASFEEAAELMSLESLKKAGAKIPDDFRLSSRVFEDLESGIQVNIRPPYAEELDKRNLGRGGNFGSLGNIIDVEAPGWGACAGGGAGTVCGCAGGSSS